MQFELLSYIDWPLGQWVIACINCWGLPEVALGGGEMSEVFHQKIQDEWVYWLHCRFWQKFEEETPPNDYVRKALLCVARRHLTPPPSYTNVKRLFNYGPWGPSCHWPSVKSLWGKARSDFISQGQCTHGQLWPWLELGLLYKDFTMLIKRIKICTPGIQKISAK